MARDDIIAFLKKLREEIIAGFERLENGFFFQRRPWERKTGGGGEIAVLRGSADFRGLN